ncbi:MAG TPA: UDP-2,3-diacylglucosamine diphosphatase LpxI [Rhizobiaceae bacterium]|nr:UDP-2,3-diacylglucosamine diphosphatase LpxI [Rhizobiaceae bacterium]
MTMKKSRADAAALVKLTASDRVALVAGGGMLPEQVAASLARSGHVPFVIEIAGEDDAEDRFSAYPHVTLPLERFPDFIALLKKNSATHVVMAGSVARRPSPWKMRWGLRLFRLLARFVVPLARGDNQLLKAVVSLVEDNGIEVVGAHEIVPDLLAAVGPMTKTEPLPSDSKDIEAALLAARTIGALDIGQAAVAIGGRAIALEGIEGTDGLLERVKGLRGHGRIAGKKRGVLVKCAKPEQELRADLPAIGLATVEAAHEAGLAGIGVEAGRSFILDHDRTIDRADALGLFILGLRHEAG